MPVAVGLAQASIIDKIALLCGFLAAVGFAMLSGYLLQTDYPDRATAWQRRLLRVTDDDERDSLASQQTTGLVIACIGSILLALLILISMITSW